MGLYLSHENGQFLSVQGLALALVEFLSKKGVGCGFGVFVFRRLQQLQATLAAALPLQQAG